MKQETVNWDNYEEYLLMEVDGELDNPGKQALRVFIEANPEVEEELHLYQGTKLVPDEALTFTRKEVLLKQTTKVVPLIHRRWLYAAAAAIVGVAIMIPFFFVYNNTRVSLSGIVLPQVKMPQTTTPPVHAPSATLPNAGQVQPASPIAVTHVQNEAVKPVIHAQHTDTELTSLEAIPSTLVVAPQTIVTAQIALVSEPSLPSMSVVSNNSKEKTGIHLAPENAAAFQNLKEMVAANLEKVHNAGNRLKETALNLRMGNKNITISF